MQQSLYSSFLSTNHPVAFPGATPVYRGYEAAEIAAAGTVKEKPKVDSGSSTPTHKRSASTPATGKHEKRKRHGNNVSSEEQELVQTDVPTKTGDDGDGGEVTDLVFIVHGIGQSVRRFLRLLFVLLERHSCSSQRNTKE